MRSNGLSCFNNVTDIGLTVFVQRRRHTNDRRFGLTHPREFDRGAELPCLHHLGYFRGLDVFDVAPPCIKRVHLVLIDVQSKHLDPDAGKLQRERQSHITKSYYRYLHAQFLSGKDFR